MYKIFILFSFNSQYQDDVTFHTFPKNVILKKKWEHALKMNITKFTNNINVCSKHFIKDDFLQFKTSNYYNVVLMLKLYSA